MLGDIEIIYIKYMKFYFVYLEVFLPIRHTFAFFYYIINNFEIPIGVNYVNVFVLQKYY